MSEKSSIVDSIPVFGIVKTATETIAKKAGADEHDARLLGTIAGAWASIVKAAVQS
jgi:hypothetical protein